MSQSPDTVAFPSKNKKTNSSSLWKLRKSPYIKTKKKKTNGGDVNNKSSKKLIVGSNKKKKKKKQSAVYNLLKSLR
jgi:hypothetical protein